MSHSLDPDPGRRDRDKKVSAKNIILCGEQERQEKWEGVNTVSRLLFHPQLPGYFQRGKIDPAIKVDRLGYYCQMLIFN